MASGSGGPAPAAGVAGRGARAPLWALWLAARSGVRRTHGLLGRAGVWDQPRWAGAPRLATRAVRWAGGCRAELDLSDYHQRGAYFYGRLLDYNVHVFMARALGPGDECIDFGANIGLLAMTAARAVGPRGRVLAVEPNPEVFARLRRHLESNRLSWATSVCAAASDREAEMTLSVPPTGNTGAGTLGKLPPRHGGRASAVYTVPVRRSDDIVEAAWGRGPAGEEPFLLVKIDVEGHETALLRGLSRTIERRRPVILAEINPGMLAASGSSADELRALLGDWGYRAYLPTASRATPWRPPRARLEPAPAGWRPGARAPGGGAVINAVFIRGDPVGRLAPMLAT